MTNETITDDAPRRQMPGTDRPVEPGKAAFGLVSAMENHTGAIRDLAYAVIMASSGATEVDHKDGQGALIRLGWQLVENCEALEAKRCEAFVDLYGIAHPGQPVVAS